jgi:hypothetical protein
LVPCAPGRPFSRPDFRSAAPSDSRRIAQLIDALALIVFAACGVVTGTPGADLRQICTTELTLARAVPSRAR